jgi:tripartite-type tricarboxylate transporter receptor subunit TctC
VVSSPADGYTLLVGSSNELVATRLVNPAQRYDAQKDMTPLGLIATAPVLLVAGPRAAVKTLPELIELARRKPPAELWQLEAWARPCTLLASCSSSARAFS